MILTISSFPDAGDLSKERIILRVNEDGDLGKYAVFVSRSVTNTATADKQAAAFWFPDGEVKENDLVVLYSKEGTARIKELSGDRQAHFHYFGLRMPMWGGKRYKAVLLRMEEWESSSPSDLDESEET